MPILQVSYLTTNLFTYLLNQLLSYLIPVIILLPLLACLKTIAVRYIKKGSKIIFILSNVLVLFTVIEFFMYTCMIGLYKFNPLSGITCFSKYGYPVDFPIDFKHLKYHNAINVKELQKLIFGIFQASMCMITIAMIHSNMVFHFIVSNLSYIKGILLDISET